MLKPSTCSTRRRKSWRWCEIMMRRLHSRCHDLLNSMECPFSNSINCSRRLSKIYSPLKRYYLSSFLYFKTFNTNFFLNRPFNDHPFSKISFAICQAKCVLRSTHSTSHNQQCKISRIFFFEHHPYTFWLEYRHLHVSFIVIVIA